MADLSFKTMGGQVGIDDALGIVECFVAAIGNKDSVGDIIIPGAFNKSLKRRKPRVVWGHDWNQPIGKVIDIFEVGSSDPRLPMKMKQAGVGAVYARVQFNLKSERGREAFSFVQFFGEEQEWSIGYKTLDAVFDGKLQANILKELELYEVSPVLHGANQLTATLSVKNHAGGDMRPDMRMVEGRPILDAEESDLRDSLLRIVSTHGRFNEDSQGVWAAYTPAAENEVAAIGVKCSNCVFYNRDGSCDIIAMDIEPEGKCRFAVIPKGVVDVDDDDSEMWLPSGDPEERMKFLEDDEDGEKANDVDEDKAAPGTDALNQIANIVGVDAPQERVTGDIARGYGPRRGNLERLLRYWRPIMKKPGGFRRCRVILADHPELYPLENICAWLHHETTGLWPNEGCHHPGMKNCKKKLKKGKRVLQGSLFSDADFNNNLNTRFGKSYGNPYDEDDEMKGFMLALKDFMMEEPEFTDFLRDDDNWESEGEDEGGMGMVMPYAKKPGCDCGCGGSKSAFDEDLFGIKAGRVLSSSNIAKLKQAADLISDVITVGEVQFKGAAFVLSVEDANDLVAHISPVVSNYDLSVSVKSQTVTIDKNNMTDEAAAAIDNAINSYTASIMKSRSKKSLVLDGVTIKQHGEWITPVVSYHGIDYTVKGDRVFYDTKGVSTEAFAALEKAVKGLGGMDPKARDADGDGMVQDNTVYQRPATPKNPVKKPSAEKPKWFYEGDYAPGPFLGEVKPSDLKPKAELAGADLRDLNLRYRDLSGAWLFDVNARGQDFTGVNLSNAKMNDADMSGSKFHKANLRHAFLVGTNLSDTDFTGADLRGANFRGADLSSAKFSGAKLEGADFTDAKLAGADFIGVELNGVTFSPGALKNSFSDQSLAEAAARASTPPKKGMVS